MDRLPASWLLHVEAAGAAPSTLKTYRAAVADLAYWLGAPLTTATGDDVRGWLIDMKADGLAPTTIRTRLTIVKIFYRWAEVERGIVDPCRGVRAPGAPVPHTPVLTTDQQRALLAVCRGRQPGQLRDTALILTMLDAGLRAREAVGLRIDDVDLTQRTLVVRGKAAERAGERLRLVPVGVRTALALDRWLGTREGVERPGLWLGEHGRPLSYAGLFAMMRRRGLSANLPGLHPHVLRHTWASEFRRAGGSEGDLMVLGGWRTRNMLDRYGAAEAGRRALDAGRRTALSDRL